MVSHWTTTTTTTTCTFDCFKHNSQCASSSVDFDPPKILIWFDLKLFWFCKFWSFIYWRKCDTHASWVSWVNRKKKKTTAVVGDVGRLCWDTCARAPAPSHRHTLQCPSVSVCVYLCVCVCVLFFSRLFLNSNRSIHLQSAQPCEPNWTF